MSSQQPSVHLTDTLPSHRPLSTFTSLSLPILSPLLTNVTVLAPLNTAIEALPCKIWQSSSTTTTTSDNNVETTKEEADKNIGKFVRAHVVKGFPLKEGEKAVSLGGREVWWEKEGEKGGRIMPDGVEVERVVCRAGDGEVWALKGVLKYLDNDK